MAKLVWSSYEDKILVDFYSSTFTDDLFPMLNRTRSAIVARARFLGLRKNADIVFASKVKAGKASLKNQFKSVHGHSSAVNGKRDPTYTTWRTMHQRCTYEHHKSYPDYGGRGVKVCAAWDSFGQFLQDMGHRPKGMTIGRIDNEKGYSPDNCEWQTYTQQARNRRNTRYVEAFGEVRPLCEWSEIVGIPSDTLAFRLRTWCAEKALSTPVRKSKNQALPR